jgi:hypothetical protein
LSNSAAVFHSLWIEMLYGGAESEKGEIGVRSCILAYSGTTDQPAHRGVMQADMVGDFLLRVSVLSLSNAKIKDLTLLFFWSAISFCVYPCSP